MGCSSSKAEQQAPPSGREQRPRKGRRPRNRSRQNSKQPSSQGSQASQLTGSKTNLDARKKDEIQLLGDQKDSGSSEDDEEKDRKPPPILAPKPTKPSSKTPPPIVAPKPTKSELLQQTRELPWIVFSVPAYQGGEDLDEFTTEGVGQGPAEPEALPQAATEKKHSSKASPFAGNIAAEAMSAALKRQQSASVDEPLVISKEPKQAEPNELEKAKDQLKSASPPPPVNKSSKPSLTGSAGGSAPDSPTSAQPPIILPKQSPPPSAEEITEVPAPKKTPPPQETGGDQLKLFDDLQPKILNPSPKKGIVKQKGKRLPRKPMRIYNDDDTYKSLALSSTASSDEVIKEMAEKNHIEDDRKYCLAEVDSVTWAERKLDLDEIPLAVVLGWDPEKRADMRLYFKEKSAPPCHANKKQTKEEQKARKEQEGKMVRRVAYRGLITLESGATVEVDLLQNHSASEVIEMVAQKAKLKKSEPWKIFESKGTTLEAVPDEALLFEVLLSWGNNFDNKFVLKKAVV